MSNCSDKWPSESLPKKAMNPARARKIKEPLGTIVWRAFMEQVLFGFALSGKPSVCSDWPKFAPVLTNQNIPLEAC